MNQSQRASIVISSYNYGEFLRESIESALAQTYPLTEVIVVDDGSSDNSPAIIAAYGDRIIPIIKRNAGQASAFNAGFARASGEVVLFLDSDDALAPTAMEKAMALFAASPLVKVHWRLWLVDRAGKRNGSLHPKAELPHGDLREVVLQSSPAYYGWPPTSGNAWSRSFLETVLPMPEAEFKTCPDYYLSALAPLYGAMGRIDEPQGFWRIHGDNSSSADTFEERAAVAVQRADLVFKVVQEHCQRMGVIVDSATWQENSWEHRISRATLDLAKLIPSGSRFILVDDDQWGAGRTLLGSQCFPFIEQDGSYWGPPSNDETAIHELERLRGACGVEFIAIAWPAFWWLDYYPRFANWLRTTFTSLWHDERLAVFDLRQPSKPSESLPGAVRYDERFLEKSWQWFQDNELRRLTMTREFTKDQQRAWFHSLPERNGYFIWGVEYESEPVGAFGLKNVKAERGQYWGYIGSKGHWGLGIGRWMVNEAVRQARTLGLKWLRLSVAPDNVRAIRLYEKCGFALRETKDSLLWMERQID